jgi:hypothetical protein
MVVCNDSDSFGLVTDASQWGEDSSKRRVQLAFFVDQDHDFDAPINHPDHEGDSW